VAACLVLLAFPAGAQAAQRYAAPGATGVTCKQSEPCSLEDAINGASADDEVIVTGGEYTIGGAPINVVGGEDIHGEFGGPMPRVVAELGGLPAINLNADGVELSYIEVVNRETEAVAIRCFQGTRLERVRGTVVGEGAAGANVYPGCAVRDSLFLAQGTNALALESVGNKPGETGADVRNVTAIATGKDSAGIQSRYNESNPGSHTLTLTNSIAEGASDLRTEDGGGGPGRIVVSNSNFDLVKPETPDAIGGPGNQSAPPLFLAPGDYREAPGSPTIDAGSNEGIGPLDLAGNPRLLGAAPDIGAFEFVPPPVAAGVLTSLSVSPKSFRPRLGGGSIASRARRPRVGSGTTVSYELTAAAPVEFTVERRLPGRRVGGECRKQTVANRGKKKCARFRALKGSFTDQGAAGANGFRFSGRIGGRALKPGKYRLVATTGRSDRRASFKIVR
jgi:hypothetical protein